MKIDHRPSYSTPLSAAPTERAPEIMRRVLLGATTALLAARMLAPGEDPGLLHDSTGAVNLILVLLWLLTAVGLAAWRVWSRRGDWRGGLVETALLVAVVLAFVSAETAGYRRPARLIAWDWLALFIAVCLIRQLAVSVADQRALFGVFLAGAAALSFQAVYQTTALAAPASATFMRPDAFAAWLALFLPGLIAAVIVCRPGRAPRWQTVFTAVFALLGAAAFAAAVYSAVRMPDATDPPLLETWRATLDLIRNRPWLGVGAGNFSRVFPRFEGPNGGVPVADPHNFLLEIAATLGVAAPLCVLFALGAFFVRAARWLLRKAPDAVDVSAEPDPGERIAWEYYIGGMCGLVLGFVLRMTTGAYSPAQVLGEGGIACGRCFVWLTAFILFERVAWSGRARVAALAFGVAAALGVLMVSPGIGLPSLAVPLWAAVALALNALPQPANVWLNRSPAARIVPLPAAALIALLFFLNVFNPVASDADQVRKAAAAGESYRAVTRRHDPRFFDYKDNQHSHFLTKEVIEPLQIAATYDPDDARVPVLLAHWIGELWIINANPGLAQTALVAARRAQDIDPLGRAGYDAEVQLRMELARALEGADRIPGLAIGPAYRPALRETRWPDPLGRAYIEKTKAKYRDAVNAGEKNVYANEPAIQYLETANVLERYLPNDPNDAALRFRLADTWFKAWEDDRCREQAREALRLDAAAPRPALTDDQRRKLNVWKDLPRGGG